MENEKKQPQISQDQEKAPGRRRWRLMVGCYLEMAKARLAALVVLTTVVGYLLAARESATLTAALWTVIGTALSACGANILNQLLEEDRDRRMERTRNRPLPAGRVSRSKAAVWGILSAAAGVTTLAVTTNRLTAGLSLIVILLYVLIYTPLKVRTPFNTVVGAVCGAVPPMMGWTAATGRLEVGAWILFGILFVWQMPHFLSLAWLYRVDYDRGGFRMLPTVDHSGAITARLAILYAGSLLPITAALSWFGISGSAFLVSSQILGLAFTALGWQFLRQRTDRTARRLFLASIAYLPLLLALMVIDMDDRILGWTRSQGQETVTVQISPPDGVIMATPYDSKP